MPAATMAWAVPSALSALGLVAQNEANRKSQNQANQSLSNQDAILADRVALNKRIQTRFEELKASGAFSADRRIDQLDKDTARYESRDSGNLAGALKVAGYKAGDSEIGGRLDAVKTKYRDERDRSANQIRREATSDEMAAMQGQMQASSGLDTAAQIYGDRASRFQGQIQSLGPAVAGFGSWYERYLANKQKTETKTIRDMGTKPNAPFPRGG